MTHANLQMQATSNDIASKVEEAEKTEQEIDEAREQYRSVAVRASLLFFCIAELAGVDPMYQYSLAWFVALFLRTVQATPEVSKADKSLTLIILSTQSSSVCNKHGVAHSVLACCKH